MGKKNLGRTLTAALAVAATMSMGMPAMAATQVSDGTGSAALGTVESSDTALNIPKGIVLYNEEAGTYYSPTIAYTYTVAPATVADNAKVTDSDGDVSRVHAGPADGVVINAQPEFTSHPETMNADGEEIKDNLELSVDLSKFGTTPGIYRYVITDTTPESELYAAGMERESDYQTTRYLDVYITRNASGDMEVAGYVLLKENTADTTDASKKSQGFVEDDDEGAAVGFDTYETYNVTLTKDVEGTMGDRTHEFPFAATITNNGYNYTWAEGTTSTAPATLADSGTTPFTSVNLKHNDEVYIKGLNAKATIAYTETIDVNDVYKVKVDGVNATGGSSASLVAEDSKELNDTTALSTKEITNYTTINSTTNVKADASRANNVKDVTFTNTIDQVSPTGLALRYAPYMFMLAIGGAMIALFRRKKAVDRF